MGLRVLRGHPWHTPRTPKPVCHVCARPATAAEVELNCPTVVLLRAGGVRRGTENRASFRCDDH